MKVRVSLISLVAGLMIATTGIAQTTAGAPAGSTGLCKDGSDWNGATKQGACRGHKGVKDWYGGTSAPATAAPASAPATPAAASATATPAAKTAAPAAAAPAAAPAATPAAAAPARTTTAPATAAAGGGAGQVWVNKSSKVYHCSGDRWYGKTKKGSYMTEADAVAQGNRPDHGKACH